MIDHQKVLCYERGYHTYMAEALAKKAAEVWLYTPILGQQPRTMEDMIGYGLDGVEKIDDFEEYKDKADLIFFPGEFDGEICDRMWKEDRCAFGSGLSAEIEINRSLFLILTNEIGLKPIRTYIAEGFEDAIEYFKKRGDTPLWIKTPYTRKDWDTLKFESLATFMPWIIKMRATLGEGAYATKEILIQDNFPAECEAGGDRYIVNGKRTPKGFVGYEVKDKGYIYRVTDNFPEPIDSVDAVLEPEFAERGYRGAWSTEIRINKNGVRKFTDATARFGSPPGQGYTLSYNTFPDDVWDVANGKMPQMKDKAQYGAIVILSSWFNEESEVCIEFPEEYEDNVKLQHHYKKDGRCYCLPNDAKDGYFGAVVAVGDSVKECEEKALAIAGEIKCLGLDYDESVFDKTEEIIKRGEEFGIHF